VVVHRIRFLFVPLAVIAVVTACGGATTRSLRTSEKPAGDAGSAPASTPGSFVIDAGEPAIDAGPPRCGYIGDLAIAKCPVGMWCDRGTGICADESRGTCKPAPTPAPPPDCSSPVCGCDGKTYCHVDDARRAGFDVVFEFPCTFTCGTTTCNGWNEYCDHASGGAASPDGGGIDTWQCKRFEDAGCGIGNEHRTCDCVQTNPSTKGEQCTEKDGTVRVEHFLP